MTTYFMFGRYSAQALKGISAERTKAAEELIGKMGGKIEAMYVLLGRYDLVLIVSLPALEDAIKASIALTKLTDIAFSTAPAMPVGDFDKLVAK